MSSNMRALLLLVAGLMLGHVLTSNDPPLVGARLALAQQDLTAFSQDWELITPDDDVTLDPQPRALFICDADGGVIDMTPYRDPTATPRPFPVSGGTIYPLSPGRVRESSTANCIIALY